MPRRSIVPVAIGVLSVLILSGCASPAEEPAASPTSDPPPVSPSPSPPPTTPAQPSVSPQPPAIDSDDPSTWTIGAWGIGPIETGSDFAATLSELPAEWRNDEHCSWAAWWNASDSSYSLNFVRGTESEQEPVVLVSTSAADPISPGVGPRTEEGLGIGSSRDEVMSEYPDAVAGQAQIGEGTWLAVPTANATMFFEYYTANDQANAVTVTTLEAPPYEVCG